MSMPSRERAEQGHGEAQGQAPHAGYTGFTQEGRRGTGPWRSRISTGGGMGKASGKRPTQMWVCRQRDEGHFVRVLQREALGKWLESMSESLTGLEDA